MLTATRLSFARAFTLTALATGGYLKRDRQPLGHREPAYCSSEGAIVNVPQITNNPCITCKCEHYKITCAKKTCPKSSEKCYFHLDEEDNEEDKCCVRCKGCSIQGKLLSSGEMWTSDSDSCVTNHCLDGIVTRTAKTVCYTPCSNPVPLNGSCCPVCQGCYLNGKLYAEGETISAPDPCIRCSCRNGNLICNKTACPVLACPVNLYMHEPGSCCPYCHGSRKIATLENRCIVGKKILRPNQQIAIDSCTTCLCQNSTLLCKRHVCPVLTCLPDYQERRSGECCPRCLPSAPVFCEMEEATYNNGDSWKIDVCVTCQCQDGLVQCAVQSCPSDVTCNDGEELYRDKNDCCPKCVPKTAVCTVYGDPHYKTFDGNSYSFQGRCKYIAAEECDAKNKRFEIHLRNDARKSVHFTWTKSVAVNLEHTKILLLQKLRVRINRKEVRLPYVRLGVVSIISNGYSITLRTIFGLKLTWDGDSFVEITLPAIFRNQVCGLCGNYNGNATDDLIIRDTAAMASDIPEFAQSWLVNRKTDEEKCAVMESQMINSERIRPRTARNIPCPGHPIKKSIRVLRDCRIFKASTMRACRILVDAEPYYRSCLEDLCDCPKNRACLCQSITAFLRECERRGGNIRNVKHTHCKII
ncbi:BMP-binding endothelial regulator protein-like isoform X2 [Paramacrobiotus metropolitanus]|uniref:BMP-binding endothelial regulator protein-like isoform X2 n=1 Tax=Paramacrobiotus metropolitanus TaxID=2943436 RepID=UPI0024460471|nr:BMP-binding endothelial regulator protein-like isoform X2 [Paramacrobiotus metropolitanus]